VEYKDTKWPGAFDLSRRSVADLVALQKDRNDWKVRQARRILTERKPAEAIAPLKDLALNGATQEICVRGLWALYCIGGFDEDFALFALKSPHPWMRVWAVRFIDEGGTVANAAIQAKLVAMAAKDPAPEVRSQLASTSLRLSNYFLLPKLLAHDEDFSDPRHRCLSGWRSRNVSGNTSQSALRCWPRCPESKLAGRYVAPRFARKLVALQSRNIWRWHCGCSTIRNRRALRRDRRWHPPRPERARDRRTTRKTGRKSTANPSRCPTNRACRRSSIISLLNSATPQASLKCVRSSTIPSCPMRSASNHCKC
jgi:hypothetical protein